MIYTDYPLESLGDEPWEEAPIREVNFISYDGDKYCQVEFEGQEYQIKRCYLYTKPVRLDEAVEHFLVIRTDTQPDGQ